MNEHHIHDLFRQYFDHTLTKDQLNTLIQAMDKLSEEDFLLLMEEVQPEDTAVALDLYAFKEKLIFQRVKVALEEDRKVRPIGRRITRKVVIALATAAAAVSLIFYFFPFTLDKKRITVRSVGGERCDITAKYWYHSFLFRRKKKRRSIAINRVPITTWGSKYALMKTMKLSFGANLFQAGSKKK